MNLKILTHTWKTEVKFLYQLMSRDFLTISIIFLKILTLKLMVMLLCEIIFIEHIIRKKSLFRMAWLMNHFGCVWRMALKIYSLYILMGQRYKLKNLLFLFSLVVMAVTRITKLLCVSTKMKKVENFW